MAALALLLGALGAGCPAGEVEDGRPLVVVSVLPQRWVVDQLGAELVRSDVLVPPGASPALWSPTAAQLRALGEARLYVEVGHPAFAFEGAWLHDLLAERPDLEVVRGFPSGKGEGDPHVWLSPPAMRVMVERTAAALAALLPEHAGELAERRAALLARIDALDAELRVQLAPVRGHRFVVMHPAWGSFAATYGLVQIALEPERKEPDPHLLAQRIAEARAAGVRVVFTQPQVDPTPAETVAHEIGARVELLDPLAYDWEANLHGVATRLAAEAVP